MLYHQTSTHSNQHRASYVSAPRVYKGHILSFEAKSGYIIKSISITYDSSYKGNSMTAGIALDGNTVTDNPTAVNRTWSTASSGTHLVSSASDDGHAAIYIQNVCGSSSTDNVQLRPTAISINYDVVVVPSHTATFSINGITTSDDIVEGESIIFPTNPVIDGLAFVGWTTTAIVGTTEIAPTFVESANMGTSDIIFYAVFASSAIGTVTKTDELSTKTFGSPSSYSDWSDKRASDGSDAVYAGNSTGGTNYIQLRSTSPSGIVSTTSGGNAKKVTVTWNSTTVSGRTLDIYGKNTAYSNSSNLYTNSTQGTKLGSIVYGTSTELTITGDYTYIGLRSNNGAMYFNSISIDWETTGTVYSAYRTTISPFAISISDSKYATFCDDVARDFSGSGITVYAATATANSVELDEVTDGIVPANTGVVLYSATAVNDVEIPVATTDASYDFSANEMIGVNTQTTVALAGESGKTNYILANGGSGVGFYKAKAEGAKLAAHKAYLSTATAAAARGFLGFEEETTGIESIANSMQSGNAYYNLAGQRVAMPTKGLFIVNGKKVVK